MDREAAARHRRQGFALTRALLRIAEVSAVLADAGLEPRRWLGPDDAARLESMASPRRRGQFVAGRWLARQLAAAFTGSDASAWRTGTAASGAAVLSWMDAEDLPPVHLSLSHSADRIAVAVAAFPLGVDVESTAKTRDWLALAGKVFATGECERLRSLPEADRRELFHHYWTLREAAGKRDGAGLRFSGGGVGCALECPPPVAVAATWQFEGYCLALVGEPGMQVETAGITAPAQRRFWRFDDAQAQAR